MDITSQPEKTVRISLAWIVLSVIVVLAIGMAGGALMQQLFPPAQPLVSGSDRLLTTVQEVTISPNTAATDLVNTAQRSVLLLSSTSNKTIEATGVVVTNDGVVVTPHTISGSTPFAYDERGVAIPLQLIGRDELFGLTYYRISTGVFPALDLRRDDPAVAHELLLLSRSKTSFQPHSNSWKITEHVLPTGDQASGIQRMMKGTTVNDEMLVGSPLLDDESRMSGIVLDPAAGEALPIQQIQDSLSRVVGEKREFNPFKQVGFSVRYVFVNPTATEPLTFGAQITAVTPGLPAGKASLEAGDVIIEVDGQSLLWATSPATTFSKALPFSVTVLRDGQKQTISLSAL